MKSDILSGFMKEMKRRFQNPISIKDKGGKGKIVFEYRTPEELEGIIKKLTEQE